MVLNCFTGIADNNFPIYNFCMLLMILFISYIVYQYLTVHKFIFKTVFLEKNKEFLFNTLVLSFLYLCMETSDSRGLLSTQTIFKTLLYLYSIKIIFSWFFEKWKEIKELRNEKTNTELMHLKSQINPHFFFNTLNNLYGLASEKSDKTPELILKLSNIMRYTIYEGKKDFVDLNNEINYVENFIELNKMRYKKKIDIQFKKNVDRDSYKVMPLLFINLIENAFKHGVENLTKDVYVYINLTIKNSFLKFNIINNFDPEEIKSNSGIGIENLRRRLTLIYPESNKLSFLIENDEYHASLEVKLK